MLEPIWLCNLLINAYCNSNEIQNWRFIHDLTSFGQETNHEKTVKNCFWECSLYTPIYFMGLSKKCFECVCQISKQQGKVANICYYIVITLTILRLIPWWTFHTANSYSVDTFHKTIVKSSWFQQTWFLMRRYWTLAMFMQ